MAARAHSSSRTMTTTTMMMAVGEGERMMMCYLKCGNKKSQEFTSLLFAAATASAIMIGSVGNGVRRWRAVHNKVLVAHPGERHLLVETTLEGV